MDFNIRKGMVDSHFHTLEMSTKGFDLKEILSKLHKGGINLLLDAGVELGNFEKRLLFQKYHPGLYFAAGIHPNTPKSEWSSSFKEALKKQGMHPAVKAIGETGLDFYWESSTPNDQYELLDAHYAASLETQKPLIFHCRNAEKELRDWIKEKDFPYGAVLHCFSGDEKLGKQALEKGFMISLAGNSTFKNAATIRNSLSWIPVDKLLIETDAPYLSPHPLRGKPNHPGNIGYTYEMIAKELEKPLEDLIPLINQNLRRFLQLIE